MQKKAAKPKEEKGIVEGEAPSPLRPVNSVEENKKQIGRSSS